MPLWTDARRIARFLVAKSTFESRPNDIFIGSYPHSGGTWLQRIVHVLAANGDVPYPQGADLVPWFEHGMAQGACWARDLGYGPGPRLFKTRLPLRWLPRPGKYIYVQRDGRDVAVSYYQQHYPSSLHSRAEFASFFERFVSGDVPYAGWFEHVAAWRRHATESDVLIIDYEHMRSGLIGALRRISRFCGFEHSESRLAELERFCHFDFARPNRKPHVPAPTSRVTPGMHGGPGDCRDFRDYYTPAELTCFERRLKQALGLDYRELRLWVFLQ